MAVRLGSDDFYCALYLARAYTLKHENELGDKMYRRAIEISPRNAASHLELGVLLFNIGKKAEGKAEIKRVLELNPTVDQAKKCRELLGTNQ